MDVEELQVGPDTTLRVTAHSAELLEFEATYRGHGPPPPAHLHPQQGECFEVLTGAMRTRIDHRDGVLEAGDVIEIPRGTAHQMWHDDDEPAVVTWQTRPAGRTLEWFRELSAMLSGQGRTDGAELLAGFSDVFRLVEQDSSGA